MGDETTARDETPPTSTQPPGGRASTSAEAMLEIARHRMVSTTRRSTRAVRAFAKRPATALAFTAVLLFTLLGAAGAAGAYVMPHASPPRAAALTPFPTDEGAPQSGRSPSTEESDRDESPGGSTGPSPSATGGSTAPGIRGLSRPADALAGWAVPIASRLDVPAVALQAYGYAELVLARTSPACKLSWTTLAGIGKIESNHGRANGAKLGSDGRSLPAIIGPPLDGQNGHDRIADTDGGRLDGDRTWDHAIGPMQFIPSTWERYATDADNDGAKDPNDINDAALAAGAYLCSSGRDLSTASGWYGAAMTYNAVRAYVNEVYAAANDYGIRSRG